MFLHVALLRIAAGDRSLFASDEDLHFFDIEVFKVVGQVERFAKHVQARALATAWLTAPASSGLNLSSVGHRKTGCRHATFNRKFIL
jgi:hypothetical protein